MPSITPIGTDIAVNTVTANIQTTPVTARLADGKFIVVWTGEVLANPLNNANYVNADIRAQIFNADGTPSGAEFVVNTTTGSAQLAPAVIQLTDGNILIAWQDQIGSLANPASTPAAAIRAQEFTSAGATVGSEFQIGAGSEALIPALAPVAGGGFIAAWQQGRSGNVVAQVFDNTNATVGAQIAIDSTNLATLAQPRLSTLENGNFVIGWLNSFATANSQYSLQVYGVNGQPVSAELPQYVGAATAQLGSIIALASGGFGVSSQYNVGTQATIANFDLFLPDGTYGTTTQVAQQPINSNANVRLAPLPNGGLVATWLDNTATGTQPDIRIQAYNPIGEPVGQQFTVNTGTTGTQFLQVVTSLSTGDLVVAWRDDSSGAGEIRARLIDYDATNAAPTTPANSTLYISAPFGTNPLRLDPEILTSLATDTDGDVLSIDQIANVTNGTAFIDADSVLNVSQAAGATSAVSFDYTVDDGNGGSATGRVRIINPTDAVTLRGTNSLFFDFLGNDFLEPRANGYFYTEFSDFTQLTSTGGPASMIINPFGNNSTAYYDLLVGQNQQILAQYEVRNPVSGVVDFVSTIEITLQGWAQIGGTGTDFLAGSALPDSLQGGTGAANELIGGAGDDTYTSRAAGDSIIELAGGGTDTVRTDLSVFTLAANVENLLQTGNPSTFVGVGNADNNIITGISFSNGSVLAGLGGNDSLTMLSSGGAELIGGTGDDTYTFTGATISVVEFANEGTDTIRTGLSAYTLPTHVENLTYTGTGQFQAVGNAANNVFNGSATGSVFVGLGGNDTYQVRNIGDTIVEAAGEGIDTVRTGLSVYRLNAANVENLTYTGFGNFTGIGNALDNAITGATGRDLLFAGAGVDTLTGGAGGDIFLFDAAVDGIDIITDFTSGSDRLFFNRTVFTQTPIFNFVQGPGPQTPPPTPESAFLYNSTTGLLSYDADGNGAGAAVAIATLTPSLVLTTADFVFYG